MDPKLIEAFLIFKNRDRSYPMVSLPDNIAGVSYRKQPRSWMDNVMFEQCLREPSDIRKDVESRTRQLFMDNCSCYKHTENFTNALLTNNTEFEFLLWNSKHLCSPLDSFIIQ